MLVPVHEVPVRRFALHHLLAIARGFLIQLQVLHDVLRRLRHHPADVVKPFAPRAPANLMKVARAQEAGLLAIELAELREQHGANRHVDAHAERVRAANDLQQTALRELLDEHAIFHVGSLHLLCQRSPSFVILTRGTSGRIWAGGPFRHPDPLARRGSPQDDFGEP